MYFKNFQTVTLSNLFTTNINIVSFAFLTCSTVRDCATIFALSAMISSVLVRSFSKINSVKLNMKTDLHIAFCILLITIDLEIRV